METSKTLSSQLIELAEKVDLLRSSDLYGMGAADAFLGRTPKIVLPGLILRARVLLENDRKFSTVLNQLNILSISFEPRFLEVVDVLKLAAEIADRPDVPPIRLASNEVRYIDEQRIAEIKIAGPKGRFDVTKLVRLCEELNSSFSAGNYMATAMLLRAIKDHCPPIFGQPHFAAVLSNTSGLSRSRKQLLDRLQNSLTHEADGFLHEQIRQNETLPSDTQVSFKNEINALLEEIAIRLPNT